MTPVCGAVWKTPVSMATDSAPTDAEFIAKISALCGEWNRAEEWIKRGEIMNRNVLLPSINELRYAGRRLVDACEARERGDHKNAETYLQDAEQNLIRARHDVVDAIAGFVSDRANECRDRLGADRLQKHFAGYGALFGLLNSVLETTALSRNERTRRNEIYEAMMRDDLPRLQDLYRAMETSLPAIEENIGKENKRHIYVMLFGITGVIIGVIGVLV